MIGKGLFPDSLRLFLIGLFIVFSEPILFADDKKQRDNCLDQAVKRIIEIRSLSEKVRSQLLWYQYFKKFI